MKLEVRQPVCPDHVADIGLNLTLLQGYSALVLMCLWGSRLLPDVVSSLPGQARALDNIWVIFKISHESYYLQIRKHIP